ncbi:hypothetical protein ACHAXR_009064, partial [Thalassiosira sp. AJA248-18]
NNNQPPPSSPPIIISPSIKKLPFLLLEDTLDSLPLTLIQTLWLPSSSSTTSSTTQNHHQQLTISSYITSTLLCSPLIFVTSSKFVLLRICNKLLKLLSNRDVDAEFAGSIMVMMSNVFPLSERSAVNVLGTFNVRNETVWEDEGVFDGGGGVKLLLHCDNMGEEYDGADGADGAGGGKRSNNNSSGSGSGSGSSIGYEFYKTFWGVQKVFTDPQGTILSSRGGLTQAAAASAYGGFVKDITTILVALESTPVSKSSSSSSMKLAASSPSSTSNKNSNSNNNADKNNIVRHHKYLTSSQLLHLQLKDPTLRIHFLSQLLIILTYLTNNSPTVILPTPPIAPSPGSDPTKLAAQIKKTQLKTLMDIMDRSRQLLHATTPSGETMLRSLQWLLKDREGMWRAWKRGKCMPAMDKVGGGGGGGSAGLVSVGGREVKKALLCGRKRKGIDDSSSTPNATTTAAAVNGNNGIQMKDCMQSPTTPKVSTFLDPYVEALDPENGIDDEYHPRNDMVYCWRALRLLARDQSDNGADNQKGEGAGGGDDGDNDNDCGGHLSRFGKLRRNDGDFEGIVRSIWTDKGEAIGGTIAETYYDEAVEDDDVDYTNNGEDAAMKDGDLAMDDVSVGTPVEETEAKKEKMDEFEKMLNEEEEEMLTKEEVERVKDEKEGASGKSKEEEEEEGGGAKDSAMDVEAVGDNDKKSATTTTSSTVAADNAKKEVKKKVEADSKVNGCPIIHDAATETIMSMLNEEPKKKVVVEQQQSSSKKTEATVKPATAAPTTKSAAPAKSSTATVQKRSEAVAVTKEEPKKPLSKGQPAVSTRTVPAKGGDKGKVASDDKSNGKNKDAKSSETQEKSSKVTTTTSAKAAKTTATTASAAAAKEASTTSNGKKALSRSSSPSPAPAPAKE